MGLSPAILRLLDTPAEIMEGSVTYLQIYFMGVIALMIYNMGSGILRAIGDSRTPLYFLMVSSVVNIVLDLVFVINVQMGVAGVAWATLIAQVISAGLVLIRLITTKECYRLILKDIRFHKHALLETIRIACRRHPERGRLLLQPDCAVQHQQLWRGGGGGLQRLHQDRRLCRPARS